MASSVKFLGKNVNYKILLIIFLVFLTIMSTAGLSIAVMNHLDSQKEKKKKVKVRFH